MEQVKVDAPTDDDAIPDGFPTATALPDELRMFYGEKLNDGYKAFRIVFERVEN